MTDPIEKVQKLEAQIREIDQNQIQTITDKLNELEREIDEFKEEARVARENQLKWGVRILGAVIIAMGGWIWSQVGHIFELGANK